MKKKELSVSERHQLRIARRTLEMNDAAVDMFNAVCSHGGMTKEEAREVIKRLGGGKGDKKSRS